MILIKYYVTDLNPHGGLDRQNIFPCFFKKMAVFLAPKLAKILRGLSATGSFPILWRTANITPIPKGKS